MAACVACVEEADAPETSSEERNGLASEAREAFKLGWGPGRRRRRRRDPDLAWLHLQCSGGEGGGGESLYPLYVGDRSKLSILDKQTCRKWKSRMDLERVRHPRRQRQRTLLIQPITHLHGNPASSGQEAAKEEEEVGYRHTHISETVLDKLLSFCSAYFSEMRVKLMPPLDLSDIPKLTSRIHGRTNRRQFLVDDIIHFLSSRKLRGAYCILGVTVVDLYPGPQWNFVLGQADMEKGSGVFSFGRYFNSGNAVGSSMEGRDRDGTGAGEEAKDGCGSGGAGSLSGRGSVSDGGEVGDEWEQEQMRNLWVLMRVMSHELCHLFGLAHCHYFQCAMNESSSISEAATQPLFLCPLCLRKLHHVHSMDLTARFSALLQILKELRLAVVAAGAGVSDRGGEREGLQTQSQSGSDREEREQSEGKEVQATEGGGSGSEQGGRGKDREKRGGVCEQGEEGVCEEGGDQPALSLPTESTGHHLEQMDAAIAWLQAAVQSITGFKLDRTSRRTR